MDDVPTPLIKLDAWVEATVADLQNGDEAALQALYRHFAVRVRRHIMLTVHDEYTAEDLTQEVFIKLMKTVGRYEPRGVPFSAWLLRVARNVALDHQRRARPILTEQASPELVSEDVRHERRRDLRDALAALPDEQRGVFVLRYLVGLSPAEVGLRLGKSPGAVRGLEQRARVRMRSELERSDATPRVLCYRPAPLLPVTSTVAERPPGPAASAWP